MIGAITLNGMRRMAANSGTQVSTIMQADDVAHIHAGDQAPDEVLLLGEQ